MLYLDSETNVHPFVKQNIDLLEKILFDVVSDIL